MVISDGKGWEESLTLCWFERSVILALGAVVYNGFGSSAAFHVFRVWNSAWTESGLTAFSADDAAVFLFVAVFFHPLILLKGVIGGFIDFQLDSWNHFAFNTHLGEKNADAPLFGGSFVLANASEKQRYIRAPALFIVIKVWRRGTIPSLQSPAHGCRLRHLSTRAALQPCTYSTRDWIIFILVHVLAYHRFLPKSYERRILFRYHSLAHLHKWGSSQGYFRKKSYKILIL